MVFYFIHIYVIINYFIIIHNIYIKYKIIFYTYWYTFLFNCSHICFFDKFVINGKYVSCSSDLKNVKKH